MSSDYQKLGVEGISEKFSNIDIVDIMYAAFLMKPTRIS
jgi:hypothetical protein